VTSVILALHKCCSHGSWGGPNPPPPPPLFGGKKKKKKWGEGERGGGKEKKCPPPLPPPPTPLAQGLDLPLCYTNFRLLESILNGCKALAEVMCHIGWCKIKIAKLSQLIGTPPY